jgi:hypothetical protein
MRGGLFFKTLAVCFFGVSVLGLAACSAWAPVAQTPGLASGLAPWAPSTFQSDAGGSGWQPFTFPGKAATEFNFTLKDKRPAVLARAASSASMLRHAVHIAPADLGRLKFSWNVPELIAQANLSLRDKSDSPVRVVLAFEGDRSVFSAKDSMLSELSLALTGEPMPYATLMYVWSNTQAPGTVIANTRTDRIRKLVVESGRQHLNQWLDYDRDVAADFKRAFGESPGALVAVGIMTDSDNTRTTTQAWYGPVTLAAK